MSLRKFKKDTRLKWLLVICAMFVFFNGIHRNTFLDDPLELLSDEVGISTDADYEHAIPVKQEESIRVSNPDRHKCKDWFEKSFDENLLRISRYPMDALQQYKQLMGGDDKNPRTSVKSFPVIATASDFYYTKLLNEMIASVKKYVKPNYNLEKLIIYDLGMYPHHITRIIRSCRFCEIRRFPFDKFPKHVNTWSLRNYSWKPLLVRTLLIEYGWVWFLDASIRFTTSDLDRALQYSKEHSILFYTSGPTLSVARQTDSKTFEFLSEDSCKYRNLGEISSGFVLFHYDNVTQVVVDAWVSCALSEQCITPTGANKKLYCSEPDAKSTAESDGVCHRFDQSVLGIILRRLYFKRDFYPNVDGLQEIYYVERTRVYELRPEDMYYYRRYKHQQVTYREEHQLL